MTNMENCSFIIQLIDNDFFIVQTRALTFLCIMLLFVPYLFLVRVYHKTLCDSDLMEWL